jgi:hypothetical protein
LSPTPTPAKLVEQSVRALAELRAFAVGDDGSLTATMMGLVVLLYAEDRVSELFDELRTHDPDGMDQRYDAWLQLGSLFRQRLDPEQFPFYEARVSNGVVYRMLEHLLVFEGERVRHRSLDIEHIGTIYEALIAERRRTGSHYTPRSLTEPIVRTTLRPVLEALGERPTAAQILDLKVCDPAMGSGAFLLEACRQLAAELEQAWATHSQTPMNALLMVAQRCLYGVDKNPFAVSLAKASLWLLTSAGDHPSTFMDHSLKCGDSLVGLTPRQIAAFHWNPQGAEDLPVPQHDQARLMGDLLIAVFLAQDNDNAREQRRLEVLEQVRAWQRTGSGIDDLRAIAAELRKQLVPFHWQLEFPEAFTRSASGFDVFIGNPPFLGGKLISSFLSPNYERLLKTLFDRSKGAADLAAYFYRQCYDKLCSTGAMGLIASNSISETATRNVGLDVIVADGGVIFEAEKAFDWPGHAAVTAARVHISKRPLPGLPIISSSLTANLDVSRAARLSHDHRYSEGVKLFGAAFVLGPDDAEHFAAHNPGLRRYLRTFVNGDVLNLTAKIDDGRVAVDFGELDLAEIEGCEHFLDYVQPAILEERENQTRQIHEPRPWLHWDKRSAFLREARKLERIIVCATPSAFLSFRFADPHALYTHSVKLFADHRAALFGLLQSRVHEVWARAVSSSFGRSVRYSTSTSFDTFPFPHELADERLARVAEEYHAFRDALFVSLDCGPTHLYARFHSPEETDPRIAGLRSLHDALDATVFRVYGWRDIAPVADFFELQIGSKPAWRYRWPDGLRDDVLARLLALNASA